MADKLETARKLLAKAESTGSPAEAEAPFRPGDLVRNRRSRAVYSVTDENAHRFNAAGAFYYERVGRAEAAWMR